MLGVIKKSRHPLAVDPLIPAHRTILRSIVRRRCLTKFVVYHDDWMKMGDNDYGGAMHLSFQAATKRFEYTRLKLS